MGRRGHTRKCQQQPRPRPPRATGNPYTSPAVLGWNLWRASGWNAVAGEVEAESGGPNWQQLTATKQATEIDHGGKPYLRSDGVDDFFRSKTTVDRTGVPYSYVWAGRRNATCPTNGIAHDRNNFAASAGSQLNIKTAASAVAPWNAALVGNVGINGWLGNALADDTPLVLAAVFDPSQAAADEILRMQRDGASDRASQFAANNNTAAGTGNVSNYLFMRGGLTLPAGVDWYGSAEITGAASAADLTEIANWFLYEMGALP